MHFARVADLDSFIIGARFAAMRALLEKSAYSAAALESREIGKIEVDLSCKSLHCKSYSA